MSHGLRRRSRSGATREGLNIGALQKPRGEVATQKLSDGSSSHESLRVPRKGIPILSTPSNHYANSMIESIQDLKNADAVGLNRQKVLFFGYARRLA